MSLFKRASQVRKKFKVCYYGGTGTGKTISALTFPKPAYIDMEGGVDWYIGRQIIPEQNTDFLLLQTESAIDVIKAIDEIKKTVERDPDEIQSVIIDPVSVFWDALQEGFLRKLQARNKDAEIKFQHWKTIKAPYKRAITTLINMPVHLVLIGRIASKYKLEKGQLIEDGVTIQTEKDTPYIADIFVRFYKERSRDSSRFMAEIEKDRTNLMKEGSHVENLTFQHLLSLAEERGILGSIMGSQTKSVIETDAASKDEAIFEDCAEDDAGAETALRKEVLALVTSDSDIVGLREELDWKPAKVLAIVRKEGLSTREEIGRFLAKHVKEKRQMSKKRL